jgi:hypothetical protein
MTTLTVIALVLLVLVGLTAMIGGVVMMFDDKGGFWSWYMGYNAFTSGLNVLIQFAPVLAEALGELLSSILSNR